LNLLRYELELINKGYKIICGVDEVGYGSCAGPLIACAIVMDLEKVEKIHIGKFKINDSKQVPRKIREELFPLILNATYAVGIGITDILEINVMNNICKSGFLARYHAVQNLARSNNHSHLWWHQLDQNIEYANKFHCSYISVCPHAILIDGPFPMKEMKKIFVKSIIRGDRKSISIASASIVAKCYRDKIMTNLHQVYPQYGWDTNCGYLTTYHREALKKYGATLFHRIHFKYVKAVSNGK